MNEDEAFIRAIVDSPGDDTPRLVYADWLDDRDDPRGPYLREEHVWAKPWRNGERPADNPALRELAVRLDPVWVARVSRPPMGVCCQHIRFEGGGRQLTTAAVDTAERELKLVLPIEYRAFLLNYNGGRPTSIPTVGAAGIEVGRPVEWLDQLDDVAAPESDFLRRWINIVEHPDLRGCIPIGTTNADADAIYLGCTDDKVGCVYIRREYKTDDVDSDLVVRCAKNFSLLLSKLKTKHLR